MMKFGLSWKSVASKASKCNPLMSTARPIQQQSSFHSSKLLANDRITTLANQIAGKLPKKPKLNEVLTAVWEDSQVTALAPGLTIRLTSIRGQICRKVWSALGNDPNQINILAVGTVAIPQHIPNYHAFLNGFATKSINAYKEHVKNNDFEVGYDLLSKGATEPRAAVLKYFNEHYGFPPEMIDIFTSNSATIGGGMRGLKDIADGLIVIAKGANTHHRFIQPDNSFGTWWTIIERPEKNDQFRRTIHSVTTDPKNKLHLTAADVREFYKQNPVHSHESWYITPVGNPSGTKMKPEQLMSVCEEIIRHNPKATIILDIVYVRTLSRVQARQLFAGIVNNTKVLNRTMFLESFSKSHGLCRERLGIYFSANEELFTSLHAANIAFSAGNGAFKDFQMTALGSLTATEKQGPDDMTTFWMKERQGLLNFLRKHEEYDNLFDGPQPHITDEDMQNPLGLYVLMKTKSTARDVLMKTGVLGVDTTMGTGKYIRFSVGTLTEPTYSKYV